MPEQTFSGLFDETAHLDWAPVDGLRQRARQRRRRQRFAAGAAVAAVVAVVAAGTAFALDPGPGPEPVPPATPAPSVSPPVSPSGSGSGSVSPSAGLGSASSSSPPALVTDVPLAAVLTPSDVGSSGWSRKDGEDGGDWQTGYTFSICPTADRTPPDEAVDRRWQILSGPSEKYVIQRVEAYSSAATARANLGWVRSNIRSCADFAHENYRISMSIVAEPSSGDEAFVVRSVGYDNQIQIRGFVRVGNLVTEFMHSDDTTDRAFTLSVKAASRLCGVTRTC